MASRQRSSKRRHRNVQYREFEWDSVKAARNLKDHGVRFEEACTAVHDGGGLTVPDPDHSEDEEREITLGISERLRLLIVVHTQRGDRIRLISARRANAEEEQQYQTRG